MKQRTRGWTFLSALAISLPASATGPASRDTASLLHLKEALAISVQHYPSIKARAAAQDAATQDLHAARTEFLPQVIVQDQYLFSSTNNVQGTTFSNGGTTLSVTGGVRDQNIYQGVWTSYATLLVDWKIFTFGRVKANVQVAGTALEKSRAELENEIFQQQVKVADAYLLLIAMQQFVTTQQQNLERAETFRSAILANTMNGLRPGADSSLANAEVAKARLSLLQAMQEERSQRVRLAQLMGVQEHQWQIDTAHLSNTIPDVGAHPPVVDTLRSPLLRYYRSLVTQQQSKATATRLNLYPSLSLLSAGWARGSGIDNVSGHLNSNVWEGIRPRAVNYMFGLAFRWNILSVPQIKRQYEGELKRLAATRFLLDEATLKTGAQLENAKLRLETALEQVKQAPLQYNAAMQAYLQSQARYRSGLSTLPELYQALYTLNRAAADQLTAYNNVWRAVLMEAAAAGDLSIFTQQLPY
ncbi:TolC family protein [Chitinophaga sp.]|uniref:TolC family protein n=1 Tax=Chitinophaga sp. TaxID=1869181 RepID=UPI0031D8DF14